MKKGLTLAILLAMTVSVASAADQDKKLTTYQQKAVATTIQGVAQKLAGEKPVAQNMQLSLAKTIDLALTNNRDIKQSQWAYEAAEAGVSSAAANKNPSIGYIYNASHADAPNQLGINVSNNSYTQGFSLGMPLFNKEIDAAIDAARYAREGAGADVMTTQQTIKLSAATNYYKLITARNKADIAGQAVRDYQEHLKNVEQQYAVGLVAKSDVLASKTSLATAETTLVQAKNGADLQERALNNLLGLPLSMKLDTADKEMGYQAYNVTLEEAKAYALLHRSELVKAAMAVKQAEEGVNKAKAGYLPSVSGKISKGWNGDDYKANDSSNWSMGAAVSLSIWDGGITQNGVRSAKATLERAKEANQAAIDSVMLAVEQAYLNLKAAEQTIQSSRTAVEQGQENFKIASLRYRAGVGTNLDVLDAETQLNQARNAYVEALYAYNTDVANLEREMGVPLPTEIGGGQYLKEAKLAPQTLTMAVRDEQQKAQKK